MKKMIGKEEIEELIDEIGLSLDDELSKSCLPDPYLLMYYKNLSRREIWIDDSIDTKTLEINRLIYHFNKMDEGIPVEERKPIKIFIHSYGGEVAACFSVVDAIELSKTPVYTYNIGVAMSAAFLILIAGHKRFATTRSTALIHSGSVATQGTFEQTEAQMKDYKHSVELMRDYVVSRTKIDQKKLNKNKSIEWYMYADEQVSNGIVDKIITSTDEI